MASADSSNPTASNAFKPIRDAAEAADAMQSDEEDDAIQQGEGALTADAGEHPVEVIESLCMECGKNGQTRLLLTMIPYFKEVIIVSFRCQHCGFHNNEIQSAGQIHELGSVYTVKVTTRADLNRQLVKSEFATIEIPEFTLTLPPSKGQLTTIESIIEHTVEDLEFDQPVRRTMDPATYEKIDALLGKLRPIVDDSAASAAESDEVPVNFTIRIDDPSGNSFIEVKGGLSDPKWSKREYKRDAKQNEHLGLAGPADGSAVNGADGAASTTHAVANQAAAAAAIAAHAHAPKTLTDDYQEAKPDEVFSFPDVCSSCGATLETFMKTVDIPHFKEVVLMSTNCHSCGYRDNEIKSGGAIADRGRKITLKVEDSEDLSRDILKSETAALTIPEIDLHLHPGTLGGRFTTLEGLLNQVYEELDTKAFARGDAAERTEASSIETFLAKLKQVMEVSMPFTVVLDDPLANSYIQNLYAPDSDPAMESEEYERNYDQNEDLGLNDIQTTGYEGEEEARLAREEDDRKNATVTGASNSMDVDTSAAVPAKRESSAGVEAGAKRSK